MVSDQRSEDGGTVLHVSKLQVPQEARPTKRKSVRRVTEENKLSGSNSLYFSLLS